MTKSELEELLKTVVTEDKSLELRKILSDEAEAHRLFLERQVKVLVTSFVSFAGIVSIAFLFFFGRSSTETKELIRAGIDERLVDYQVDEHYRERLRLFVDSYAKSEEVRSLIESGVDNAAEKAVNERATDVIQRKLREKLAEYDNTELEEILSRATADLSQVKDEIDGLRANYVEIIHSRIPMLTEKYKSTEDVIHGIDGELTSMHSLLVGLKHRVRTLDQEEYYEWEYYAFDSVVRTKDFIRDPGLHLYLQECIELGGTLSKTPILARHSSTVADNPEGIICGHGAMYNTYASTDSDTEPTPPPPR